MNMKMKWEERKINGQHKCIKASILIIIYLQYTLYFNIVSEQQDLNLRPRRPERRALPGCAMLRIKIKNNILLENTLFFND